MEYRNFRITLGRGNRKGKHDVVIESPVGDFVGTFVNPVSKEALDTKLIRNKLQVRSAEDVRLGAALQGIAPVTSTDDLDDIGNQLSEALFRGQVLGAYAQSKGKVEAHNEGLRIRIRVNPRISEYAELMSLPWEFLYDQAEQGRIELSENRVIVRDPIAPVAPEPLALKPPLRILAVVSDPKDYPRLRLGAEKFVLKSNEIQGIEVKFVDAKIRAVNDEAHGAKTRGQGYNVFHFMGHGGITGGTPALIFKGRGDKGHPVDGEGLKVALTDSVRLIFLNACDTARIPEADPFTAIPTRLLTKKMPAVVAMQFPISDAAAISFCEKFYAGLVKGVPVDQCMGEARRAIYFGHGTKPEWGTPVLFMNSPDGILFKIKEESQAGQT